MTLERLLEPASGLPVTRLLKVERDGNPLRRHGRVSPHIGKVAPLDADALDEIAGLAMSALPTTTASGPILVVGMAESALLLSWFLAARLGANADLRFTSRERRRYGGPYSVSRGAAREVRTFLEPHSHGPLHALALPSGSSYRRAVIVEDELTTGETLRNLLLTIRDVSPCHHVVTLADLRPPETRERLHGEMSRLGVELSVLDLSPAGRSSFVPNGNEPAPPYRNPFSRPGKVFERSVEDARRRWSALRPDGLYAVGECVDVALALWESLPPRERPVFRHVTRSPWLVDDEAVESRLDLGVPRLPPHFLYNGTSHLPSRALIMVEAATAPVADRLAGFFASRGMETATVEVPPV